MVIVPPMKNPCLDLPHDNIKVLILYYMTDYSLIKNQNYLLFDNGDLSKHTINYLFDYLLD